MVQLLELQRVVYEEARLNREGKPHLLAGLVRAWKELEEIKRKIRGKPDPRPVDVTVKHKPPVPLTLPSCDPGD